MRNLVTTLDLFGGLIAPREDGEPLDDYARRVRTAAETMSERDTASGDDWREAREQELSAHLGTDVTLEQGGKDPDLLDRAEDKLFTYESLSERDGPFRWPETNASGPAALYNWAQPSKGGIAAPRDLPLEEGSNGRIYHGSGYVWSHGSLWYVPARPRRVVFPLPSGTTKTVIIPWHIESRHAHRIEVEDKERLRLVASDHEHVIRRTLNGWTWESGPHTHSMEEIPADGPASMVTRGPRPRTGEPAKTGDTMTGKDAANERLAWPVRYPGPARAQTDDGVHSHLVDPNDYWSGNFFFYGENHRHEVADWTVQEAAGHDHPLTKPPIPDYRPLWPLISRHEGTKLREETGNPYVANLRIKDGWTVAHLPEGFSEELVVRYDTGDRREVPRPKMEEGDVVGLGPDAEATSVAITEVIEAYVGPDLVFKVRAEDDWTGGVSGKKIRVSHNYDGGAETFVYTGEDGRAVVRLPTPGSEPASSNVTYTITAEIMEDGSPVASTVEDIEVQYIGEIDTGYGYDYGYDYGD